MPAPSVELFVFSWGRLPACRMMVNGRLEACPTVLRSIIVTIDANDVHPRRAIRTGVLSGDATQGVVGRAVLFRNEAGGTGLDLVRQHLHFIRVKDAIADDEVEALHFRPG